MIEKTESATVVTGDYVGLYRLMAWKQAAKLAQVGLKPSHASLKDWRQQFNSTATRWAQVEREVVKMIEEMKKALEESGS